MVRNRVKIPDLPRNPRSREKRSQRELVAESMQSHAAALGIMRDELGRLHGLSALATLIDDLLSDEVSAARGEGYSWAQIGDATGMSRQAAQQKYGRRTSGANVGAMRAGGHT